MMHISLNMPAILCMVKALALLYTNKKTAAGEDPSLLT
jgi:hypothetical protein